MAQQGDMWFRIMLETRDFVSGTKLTKGELREVRKLAGELGGELGRLVPTFDKLTRLAREDGDQMQVVAASFAKTAAQTRESTEAARQYIAQLRKEVVLLREKKDAGKKLTAAEEVRLSQNKRIARQFETALTKEIALGNRRVESIRRQTTAMSAMQKQLLAIGKQLAIYTAIYKTMMAIRRSVDLAMEIESSQKQFEVFLNSASDAEFVMDRIRRLAATTPLTIGVSTQSARTLMQYGVTAGEVTGRLRQLGDVAGADTERMQRLSLAFGQITAAGRLQGQELRQLVEGGFNPLAELSRVTGESMLDLKIRMADGAVSAGEIGKALDYATSEGGRFNNMMATLASDTMQGRLQLIKGGLEEIAIEAGELAFELKPVLDGIIAVLQARRFLAEAGIISLKGHATDEQAGKLALRFLTKEALGGAVTDAVRGLRDTVEQGEKYKETLQDQTVEMIQQFKHSQDLLTNTKEELKLKELIAALAKEEMHAEAEKLQAAHELLKARKEEQEMQMRAAEINRRYEDPADKWRREATEIAQLEQQGMISPHAAQQERDRIDKDFLKTLVDDLIAAQKEGVTAAGRKSTEEFDMMRRISTSNASGKEKQDQKRHDEQIAVLSGIHTGINEIPEMIASQLPQAI